MSRPYSSQRTLLATAALFWAGAVVLVFLIQPHAKPASDVDGAGLVAKVKALTGTIEKLQAELCATQCRVEELERMLHRDKAAKDTLYVNQIEMAGDDLAIKKNDKAIVRVSVTTGEKTRDFDPRPQGEIHGLEVLNEAGEAVIYLTAYPPGNFKLRNGRNGHIEGPAEIGIRSNFKNGPNNSIQPIIYLGTYPGPDRDLIGDARMIIFNPATGASTGFARNGVIGP
jgi:hypothetical protein